MILNINTWLKQKKVVRNEILYRILVKQKKNDKEVSYKHIEQLNRICFSSKSFIRSLLLGGALCYKSYDYIIFSDNWKDVIQRNKRYYVEGSYVLIASINKAVSFYQDTIKKKLLLKKENLMVCDLEKVKGKLVIEKVNEKDKFMPLGEKRFVSIASFCKKQKIPYWERSFLYVLKDEEKIVCLLGYRLDNRVACDFSSKKGLYFEFKAV